LNKQDKKDWKGTRDGYGKGLLELGENNKNVVVLSADLTESTRANWFREKFPDRFFSFGVAEQDMISTAAGFALSGKTPFCCSFGVFASGRAWEQLRTSVSYMDLNINIGGTHGGISVGPDGATHQALEEITLTRVIPNMSVVVPCDALQAQKATVASASIPGPVYLRLSREKLPVVTNEKDPFQFGKANILKKGKDVTLIASGIMVYQALLADEILKSRGINATVINLHTIKPLDSKTIIDSVKETKAIVSCEEHLLAGGMGSAIAELLVQEYPVPMEMVAVKDSFGESGDPWQLMEKFHLTPNDIAKACEKAINRKRA
jgi:transketolase